MLFDVNALAAGASAKSTYFPQGHVALQIGYRCDPTLLRRQRLPLWQSLTHVNFERIAYQRAFTRYYLYSRTIHSL